MDSLSLRSLYKQRSSSFEDLSILEREIHAHLIGERVCVDNILSHRILGRRDLLALQILVGKSYGDNQTYSTRISELASELSNSSKTNLSAYQRLLFALYCSYAGLPVPTAIPSFLSNGAVLLEKDGHCPWRELTFSPLHVEFGTLLALLAIRSKSAELSEAVSKMAAWQLNTLDHAFKPIESLYRPIDQSGSSHLLEWNYLFFRAASCLTNKPLFQKVAGKLMDALMEKQSRIDPIAVLIEESLECGYFENLSDNNIEIDSGSLPSHILDPDLALIGFRSNELDVFSTLHGSYTGMGCFMRSGTGIINYGPHHLPLLENMAFGIEGNPLTERGLRKSQVFTEPEGYSLKGCVRMVDRPEKGHLGDYSCVWMETEQVFKKGKLNLSLSFLAFEGWESAGFSFFIKTTDLLQNYTGIPITLSFKQDGKIFEIKPLQSYGRMELVKVDVALNLWGASHIITFSPDPSLEQYSWQISYSAG